MAKILIADDSAFMRKVLSDILNKNDYKDIVEAENGEQAIKFYDSEDPDLVLLDIIMPGTDGIGVLEEIMPKDAKVIMVSAVGQDSMIEKAKSLGAIDYIIKPFNEEQVLEKIEQVL